MPRICHPTIAKLVLSCSLSVLVSHQASAVGFIVNPTSEVTGVANAGTAVVWAPGTTFTGVRLTSLT